MCPPSPEHRLCGATAVCPSQDPAHGGLCPCDLQRTGPPHALEPSPGAFEAPMASRTLAPRAGPCVRAHDPHLPSPSAVSPHVGPVSPGTHYMHWPKTWGQQHQAYVRLPPPARPFLHIACLTVGDVPSSLGQECPLQLFSCWPRRASFWKKWVAAWGAGLPGPPVPGVSRRLVLEGHGSEPRASRFLTLACCFVLTRGSQPQGPWLAAVDGR